MSSSVTESEPWGSGSDPRPKGAPPVRRSARLPLIAAVSTATILGMGGVAVADGPGAYPSKDKVDHARHHAAKVADDVDAIRRQLDSASARLSQLNQQAEIASERYNGAMWRLGQAREAQRKARERATAAHDKVNRQRDDIAHLVVQSYQNGSQFNTMTALLGKGGPLGVMSRTGVVNMAGNSMQADYQRYLELRAKADRAETRAEKAEASTEKLAAAARADRDAAASAVASAQAQEHDIAARKDQLVKALAHAQHISVSLARQRSHALEEIARQKAEAAARRKAAAEARRQAAAEARREAEQRRQAARDSHESSASGSGSSGSAGAPSTGSSGGTTPPSSGSVSAVLDYARAQIGKWYQWGADGPSTFDCSGLTMMAWRQAGVYLPHYSAAQYDAGTPIPVSAAQPGDLYFWSSNGSPSGIHHVALAVGGGRFIEAPHTGAQVRYNTTSYWYPDFAVRLR